MLLSKLQKIIGKRNTLIYLRKKLALRDLSFRRPLNDLDAVETYQKSELMFLMNMYAAI